MKFLIAVAALAATVVEAKKERTFAVMHFQGKKPLYEGRADPIVSPGVTSAHAHTVQGANGFSLGATGKSLMEKSTCSTAKIKADKSAYWMPKLHFYDAKTKTYEPVPLFYMNVYYFFDATNDDIKAFPVGLQMVSGDAMKRTAPPTGNNVLDAAKGTIQPAQFTCPRGANTKDLLAYPANSDGSSAGIADSNNKGAGAGFPFLDCDGYASPLRADLHFPSCYDPSKGLTDFKNNMQWPSSNKGMMDCPAGTIHVPHLFYEMYWNTPLFKDRWTPGQGSQPFVLANGDQTGFSLHGDFLSGWEPEALQTFIDTCDAGTGGFEKCPTIPGGLWPDTGDCFLEDFNGETMSKGMTSLLGNNPLWTYGASPAPAMPDPPKADPPKADPPKADPPKADPPKADPPKADPPKAEPPKTEPPKTEPPVVNPPLIAIPKPTDVSPPAPTVDAPPAPVTVAPTVVATTDANGEPTLITTWETVTQWLTVTVYDDEVAASPTAAPKVKRHEHNHVLRHRAHRGSHMHRR
jgi:hypothetical protein